MLAYQHISQHFGSQSNESRLKRSLSPGEMSQYRKESIDYVRQMRRRSLSRSTSPVRSHSPTYMSTYHAKATSEHHLIKRSASEEDLRVSHERRRLSMEEYYHTEQQQQQIISHRPQILMNYHHHRQQQQQYHADTDSETEITKREEHSEPIDDPDDDAPLDLSMGSKKRRGRTDSGTDSDDSTGLCDEGRGKGEEGRAYKKSLMKRYCEFTSRLINKKKRILNFFRCRLLMT